MKWLQRHAPWGLLAIATVTVISGLIELVTGASWQPEDVTGSTSDEIAAQSSAGAEVIDFVVRAGGLYLTALGVLLCAVLLFAYRRGHLWAWWAMWTLPVSIIASSALMRAFGAWGPATTGTLVGLVAAALHLAGMPRFFKQTGRPRPTRSAIGET
jgi:hypothetical protein